MTRPSPRNLATHAGLAALLLVGACHGVPTPEPPSLAGSRPNIVFVFSDDHAAHAISAYGSAINRTPNIDRLAEEGLVFRNCFCGNSICGPSRATILSGKHSHANGFMRNGNRFDQRQTTFPKLLQGAGYQTALVGKWHLTSDPVGFDHWVVLPGQGQYYNPDFITPEGKYRAEGYCTDLTTDLALDWLRTERDPDRPFLLMCQHKAPHRSWMPGPDELHLYRDEDVPEPATLFDDYRGRGPAARAQEMRVAEHLYTFYDLKLLPNEDEQPTLVGPDRWWKFMRRRMTDAQREAWDAAYRAENAAFREAHLEGDDLIRWKYQRYIKNYLRCVAGVDKSVGQILDFVEADPELAANTIVIYSSDQGFFLGDHGWYDKRWIYEESLRMPLLARWPSKLRAGGSIDALTQNIDFAPTFLDLAGAEIPAAMHGKSLVPLLEDAAPPEDWRDAIYYHYYESHAVHEVAAHYGVRTERYKLAYFYEPHVDTWELYDLEKDPDELRSVHDDPEYREVRARLERVLAGLREQYDDDTGRLGNETYDVTAGLASAVPAEDGAWDVWFNTRGGYLVRDDAPLPAHTTLSCTLQTTDETGHGQIVVSGAEAPRGELLRAGIDFAERELYLELRGERLAAVPLTTEPMTRPLGLTVDLDRRHAIATSGTATVEAEVPVEWQAIRSHGYGGTNARIRFSRIEHGD